MNCLDIYRERPVRLTVRALVPAKEHPKVGVTEGPPPSRLTTFIRRTRCKLSLFQFNFVGKLLGPKGNSMKRLQEHTMTKMAVLGKGSMRDRHQVNWIIPSEVYPLSRILCARNLISHKPRGLSYHGRVGLIRLHIGFPLIYITFIWYWSA